MTPRKRTKVRPLTDRETVRVMKLPGRSQIALGTELSVEGIRGRCTFSGYTRTAAGVEWVDVLTSAGRSRTVRPEAIRTVHRPKGA